jgi:ABC-2 type transport system permease protein
MIRVIRALWRTSVIEELQYRLNFVLSVLGTLFFTSTALIALAVFFRQTNALGGWQLWEVVTLLGIFTALGGLVEAVIRPGIGQLVSDVKSGDLDLVLARPIDAQAYVSFRKLDIWRFSDVGLGLALSAFAMVKLGRAPSPAQLAAFAVTFASAAILIYSLWVALMSTAFWFVAVENLSVLFDALFEGARYPMSAYPGALRFLFVFLVPVAWTTTIPAGTLTGRFTPAVALAALAVAFTAFLLTRWLWRVALRRYTSAGG